METQVFKSGHDTRITVTSKQIQQYGMEIVCAYKNLDPGLLLFDKEYQRTIEPIRIKKIGASIQKYGYWPQEVIIITNDMRVIDGQHRAKAAIANGVMKVPVSIVKFYSRQKEADFFAAKNNWNTALKPIDFWFARHMADDLTATYLYRLESDPESYLFRKIALKGRDTESSKFVINNVLAMMNAVFGNVDPWCRERDDRLRDNISRSGYVELRSKMNDFLNWFFAIWGNSKTQNPVPYRKDSIRSILGFYVLLIKQGFKPDKAIKKMQTFVTTADFVRATMAGKTQALVVHFNHGKQGNRLTLE